MRNPALVCILYYCIILTEISGEITGCDYFDTVDLTNSRQYENGSYLYEDVLIPKEETGEYDYEILFDGYVETVPKHTRGCVCKMKTCIRFCCHPSKMLVHGKRDCEDVESQFKYSQLLNITLSNGTQTQKNLSEFMIQQHLPVPCADHIFLDAEWFAEHKWTLYENGSLFRHLDEKFLSKRDYCLQPHEISWRHFQLVPHHCPEHPDVTYSYVQMVSVFFLLLMICLHIVLPNFKSIHFKCCTCYYLSLSIGFLILICINFELVDTDNFVLCVAVGYSGYYFMMATFLWLLIINYNLWKLFSLDLVRKITFLYYNIFVWSVAAVLLLITGSIDFIFKDEDVYNSEFKKWMPGVGAYDCWLKATDSSAIIYYYGPMLILLMVNAILFIKSAKKLLAFNKHYRSLFTSFSMFFRLFVMVGLIWIFEIVSYTWSRIYQNTTGLSIADFLVSGQGILLFAVTILNKDVLKSFANKFQGKNQQGMHRSSLDYGLAENSSML